MFFAGVQFVEALDEEQARQLLDDRKGVGDATRPHGVPDAVYLGSEVAGDHRRPPFEFDGDYSSRQVFNRDTVRLAISVFGTPVDGAYDTHAAG